MARNHRTTPLTCLRRREFGAGIGLESCNELAGIEFSSFFGDDCIDCLPGRVDVVRGSRLFAVAPDPLITLVMLPSLLAGLKAIGPLMLLFCLISRSRKYAVECDDRLPVGVGGIDRLAGILGGVVDELDRRPGLRLPPLIPSLSLLSLDLTNSPAMFRTRTAPSTSASR